MTTPSKSPNPLLKGKPPGTWDDAMLQAVSQGIFSGAALLVSVEGRIVFNGVYGSTRGQGGIPVDSETLFDLASLTKALATIPLVLYACENHRLDIDSPPAFFFPNLVIPAEKRSITLRHLLNHSSGLPPHEPFFLECIAFPQEERNAETLRRILQTPLLGPPGREARYSDLGFMLLGMVLEEFFGEPLDEIFQRAVASRLPRAPRFFRRKTPSDPRIPSTLSEGAGVESTAFRFVATERCPWRGRLLEGETHDENGYCLGGVAGHAGLFGTAEDVFHLISPLWKLYRGIDSPAWFRSSELLHEFWKKDESVLHSTWALGFDTPTPGSSSSGNHFSPHSVGHLGFTGTSFWLDCERGILVVLLTNRVHPTRDDNRFKLFRPFIHNLVMESL